MQTKWKKSWRGQAHLTCKHNVRLRNMPVLHTASGVVFSAVCPNNQYSQATNIKRGNDLRPTMHKGKLLFAHLFTWYLDMCQLIFHLYACHTLGSAAQMGLFETALAHMLPWVWRSFWFWYWCKGCKTLHNIFDSPLTLHWLCVTCVSSSARSACSSPVCKWKKIKFKKILVTL